jgi:hypothetical protein
MDIPYEDKAINIKSKIHGIAFPRTQIGQPGLSLKHSYRRNYAEYEHYSVLLHLETLDQIGLKIISLRPDIVK